MCRRRQASLVSTSLVLQDDTSHPAPGGSKTVVTGGSKILVNDTNARKGMET